ncbi:MAG: hypothetical protein FH756_02405 [Firmicutes bacterium]|nr:hypothetical protein [Bacillota bacterium]
MSFAKYFNYLVHRIFKKKSNPKENDIYKLASALGPNYDEAKQAIFALREQALVATAYGNGLDQLGKDREMPRYRGEKDDEYRRRLLAAVNIYSEGGTKPGMERALSILGYTNSEVYPLYLEKYKWRLLDSSLILDGSATLEPLDSTAKLDYLGRWAEFIIKLNLGDDPFLETQYLVAREMINKVKPSEGKLYALNFTISAISGVYYKTSTQCSLQGYFGSEVYDGVYFLNGRKSISPSPIPLLLDAGFNLDGEYMLSGIKGLAENTWFITDTRTRAEMALRQAASVAPGKVLNLDGRYWLGSSWVLGENRYPRTGRMAIKVQTCAEKQINSDASRVGIKVNGHFPHKVVYLDARYRRLDGSRELNNSWYIAANKAINNDFSLTSGGVRQVLKGGIKTRVYYGKNWTLNTGRWLLGGGFKYKLNGYLRLSALHILDGSIYLSGHEKIGYLARIGEKENMLNGRLLWDGERLDGSRRLRPHPVDHRVRVSIKKDGRIIEQGVI